MTTISGRQPTLVVAHVLVVRARAKRWGYEFKSTDAPRLTKSMTIARSDLALDHLWVVYPGDVSFPLDRAITAVPLQSVLNTKAQR